MNDQEEKFIYYYLEQTSEEMRHIETLRERVTIMVITLASAIGGFIIQQKFSPESKPLAIFIVILGIFGLLMVAKLYQIHQRLQKRLDNWYHYYIQFCGPDAQILIVRDQADLANKKKHFLLARIKHSYFWATMHVFIISGGILLLVLYYGQLEPIADKQQSNKNDNMTVNNKYKVSTHSDSAKTIKH